MRNTGLYTSKIPSDARSEKDMAAIKRDECRRHTTRAYPSGFSRRTRLRPASGYVGCVLFYFVAVSQILLVTSASTARQPQDTVSTRKQTGDSQLSSYSENVSSSSTQPGRLSSVSVPIPKTTPLQSVPTPMPLLSASTRSPSSSSAPVSQTLLSSKETTTPHIPSIPTMEKSTSSSSSLVASTTDQMVQGESHAPRTATPKLSTFSWLSAENKEVVEIDGPGYFNSGKGSLVYLKNQMDYQRREIRQLRLQLTHNNAQITNLQKEFIRFRDKQQKFPTEEPAETSSPSGKGTQTTSPTLLSTLTQLEPKSTSQHELLDPRRQFTITKKEGQILTGAFVNSITSPKAQPKSAPSTKSPPNITRASETPPKSPSCLGCSKTEVRLFAIQKELDSLKRQVNKNFSTILFKLTLLEKTGDIPEAVEYLQESALNVKQTLEKPTEREIVDVKDEFVHRKVDSGVMNDIIDHTTFSKQKARLRSEKEKVLLIKHLDSPSGVWSAEFESDRKTEVKHKTKSLEERTFKDRAKDSVDYKSFCNLAQELENFHDKVHSVYDRLNDLQSKLVLVKENTSLSIKYVKGALRGNSSLVDTFIKLQRLEFNKRVFNREKIASDYTIKQKRIRSFPKKNDTAKTGHLSTSHKVKNGDLSLGKTLAKTRDVTRDNIDKLLKKTQFKIHKKENVYHNFSWLFENVQYIQNKISNLDIAVSELSSILYKLTNRFPFEAEQKNKTIDGKLLTATEKSTSDYLGRLLSQWSITIHEEKNVKKINGNKSYSKDDQPVNVYDIPEQETNSSQVLTDDRMLALNQSEEWKSGSQMISDSAEQLPEATYGMLEALMSWINELESQFQKLKRTVDKMKTKITHMIFIVVDSHIKHTDIEGYKARETDDHKEDGEKSVEDLLLVNSTTTKVLEADKRFSILTSTVSPQVTPTEIYLTPPTSPLANITDIHERFLRNSSIAAFENSKTATTDSARRKSLYNTSELDTFQTNKSFAFTPTADLNILTEDSTPEIMAPHITESRSKPSSEIGSLETIFENVQGLLKRVKSLESQVLYLSEVRPQESMDSELPIQTDYLGSGTIEEVPVASLEIVNKISYNMSILQDQITNIKKEVASQQNQLNSVKNDVFIFDENLEYIERELSDLELKQRRDDRFYHSEQIIKSNLSLIEVAAHVAQILAPNQKLANQNLKELNESLSKQWAILDRLKETADLQETNISRISKTLPTFQEKILYVDLSKRRYKIYNSTSVVSCTRMKDADRIFLNKKTQTCYYGYGNKKMLPYNTAKGKCEDAGLHLVFMETKEERDYVSKEITQEIGGHWIGVEKFDYGWYWVRGCDAVDPVVDPPWRYNHSVSYTRAIIWGDKWSGKYGRQYYRFVCEEEPFKEEICDGFRSFERVNEWSSDVFFRSFNTLHEVDCGRLCLADPDCKGFRFRKNGQHKCALYNQGNTTTEIKTTCNIPEVCYKKIERCFS